MSRPTPGALAEEARRRSGVGDPRFLVCDVAAHFGVSVLTDPSLAQSGQLRLKDGKVVIAVRPGSLNRKRFTAAHEIAHFMLAADYGMPVQEQVGDARLERYCNAFAGDLLLPREWVLKRQRNEPIGLRSALSLAFESETSILASVAALNRHCGWDGILVQWSRSRGSEAWFACTVVGRRARRIAEGDQGLSRTLRDIGFEPERVLLRLRLGMEWIEAYGEAVRLGRSVFTFVKHP